MTAALPAWVDFNERAAQKEKIFHVPDSIEFHPISKENGLLLADDSELGLFRSPLPIPEIGSDKQLARFFRLNMEEKL